MLKIIKKSKGSKVKETPHSFQLTKKVRTAAKDIHYETEL